MVSIIRKNLAFSILSISDMASNVLSVVKAKIDRAKGQVDDFDRDVRNFIQNNSYDVVSNLNLNRTEQVWRFRLRNKDTSELAVSAGIILHILRSPLDNILSEVAFEHSGTRKDTAFPFGKDIHAFESRVRETTKHLPAEAIDLIYSFKPYGGGNELLWALHNLNVHDKHPGLRAIGHVQGVNMASLSVWNGQVLVMGNRFGQHLHAESWTPQFFAIEAMSEDPEFLTTTPGAQVECDAKPTFQIVFSGIRGFDRKPAAAVLHEMRDQVARIFREFERRFL